MLCDKCHKREAKIYCTEIHNDVKKEQYLCEECAQEYTLFQLGTTEPNSELTLGNLLSGILNSGGKEQGKEQKAENITCKTCGMTFEEFRTLGKFGCADCYHSFQRLLGNFLMQVQGTKVHVGKKPKGYISPADKMVKELTSIEILSIKLQEAIEKEEFEEAAKIRDQIKELKRVESGLDKEEVSHV